MSVAEAIVRENESTGSRYFSNRDSPSSNTWETFTDATFDSGLIIASDNRYGGVRISVFKAG
ncbi:hypothetical protein [Burkholderia sp. SRS-W-2-2016]|uniref:hypothetical protein n=1 Tax=Burkholderia sp. SRS-W-2-2016 TaxID=1926878 RepID=UPI00117C4F73|nr:hypothetical protein [Burkholderia sp. SRS-W-2-2016]